MNRVIIGIGSNIDPEHNIQRATKLIQKSFELVATSQFRETEPIGMQDQAKFINGAVLIKTNLEAAQLKAALRAIEDQLKRNRSEKHGPRTIDLDIMVWNGRVVDSDVEQRDFLQAAIRELEPWNSI